MATPNLSKRLVSGFFTLTFRRAALLAINFITINLVLARVLPVAYIGVFNIANSILSFFTFFSDIGLAAALIQKNQIQDEDLSTTFTIQEILAFLISTIVIISAPLLANFYKLDQSGVWLIRSLGFGFFLTSLKVVPAVLLERELKFNPLVLVEVLEAIAFNGLLILLTFNNFGIYAFAIAALVRSLVGVSTIYSIAPWRVRVGISKLSVKSLLNFGVPYQVNSLLALLKDRLVPLVIARMVGAVGIGYITWAQNIAFMPLEIMFIMSRITFPALSRMQDNEKGLKETLERSIFFTSLFFYPLLFGILSIAPALVHYVVSNKWQNALPLIYLFAFNSFWATLSSPFTNFLNATGRIKTTLKLMVMWTILEWSLTPLLTVFYGYFGVGFATALISFTSVIPIIIIKRILPVEILKNIWQPLICALLMSGLTFVLSENYVHNFLSLLIVVLIGGVVYFGLMATLARKKLTDSLGEIKGV